MTPMQDVQTRIAAIGETALAGSRANAEAVLSAVLGAHPWVPRPLLVRGDDRGVWALWSHARFDAQITFYGSGSMRAEIQDRERSRVWWGRETAGAVKFLSGWFGLRPERQQQVRLFLAPESAEQELEEGSLFQRSPRRSPGRA